MATKNKPKTQIVKGKRITPSDRSRKWYYNRLQILNKVMDGRVKVFFKKKGEAPLQVADKDFLNALRTKFVKMYGEESKPIVTGFFNRQITATRAAFRAAVAPIMQAEERELREAKRKKMSSQTRFTVRLDGRRDKLEMSQFKDAIAENVALIKSIPSEYFDKVGKAVEMRVRGKMTHSALIKRIKDIGGITQRRAEMIASDQTTKVTEAMTRARCRNAGIKMVMWLHSGISMRPRDYHKKMWDGHSGKMNGKPNGLNGYVFNIDRPPVIDKDSGVRGYPGDAINCKCTLVPVIEM